MDILTQDFYSYSRCINGRIASYVTIDTTQKTDKKTSQSVQAYKIIIPDRLVSEQRALIAKYSLLLSQNSSQDAVLIAMTSVL